jgi:hypothetical protein
MDNDASALRIDAKDRLPLSPPAMVPAPGAGLSSRSLDRPPITIGLLLTDAFRIFGRNFFWILVCFLAPQVPAALAFLGHASPILLLLASLLSYVGWSMLMGLGLGALRGTPRLAAIGAGLAQSPRVIVATTLIGLVSMLLTAISRWLVPPLFLPLFLLLPVVVAEKCIVAAFPRSITLMKGHYLRVIATAGVIMMVMFVLTMLLVIGQARGPVLVIGMTIVMVPTMIVVVLVQASLYHHITRTDEPEALAAVFD